MGKRLLFIIHFQAQNHHQSMRFGILQFGTQTSKMIVMVTTPKGRISRGVVAINARVSPFFLLFLLISGHQAVLTVSCCPSILNRVLCFSNLTLLG
jgi:hypothetical protein